MRAESNAESNAESALKGRRDPASFLLSYDTDKTVQYRQNHKEIDMTNLKRIRESRGLTQSQLAKLADIDVRAVQDYEQGKSDINKASVIRVYRLAKALKCKIEDIMEL